MKAKRVFSVLFVLLIVIVAVTMFFVLGPRQSKTYAGAKIVQAGQVL